MVTHCLCHDLSFERLREIAEREGLSFEALRDRTKCSTGCTMCEPYVRLMLKTGKTSLPVLSPSEVEKIMRERQGEAGRP